MIPVSVVGAHPYIVYNEKREWVGGSEFQIVDVYSKKFGFTPKFIRAKGFDNAGSVVEMVGVLQILPNKLISTFFFIMNTFLNR